MHVLRKQHGTGGSSFKKPARQLDLSRLAAIATITGLTLSAYATGATLGHRDIAPASSSARGPMAANCLMLVESRGTQREVRVVAGDRAGGRLMAVPCEDIDQPGAALTWRRGAIGDDPGISPVGTTVERGAPAVTEGKLMLRALQKAPDARVQEGDPVLAGQAPMRALQKASDARSAAIGRESRLATPPATGAETWYERIDRIAPRPGELEARQGSEVALRRPAPDREVSVARESLDAEPAGLEILEPVLRDGVEVAADVSSSAARIDRRPRRSTSGLEAQAEPPAASDSLAVLTPCPPPDAATSSARSPWLTQGGEGVRLSVPRATTS